MKKILKQVLALIKKRWLFAIVIVALAGLLLYHRSTTAQQSKIDSYTVKKQALQETLVFSGEVDADEKATLKFQAAARLAWVGAKEGDYVQKFQTVASLDQRDLRKKLDLELQDYLKTRADFDQSKDDNPKGINDRMERILAKSQYDLNKAVLDVEIQNLAIELASIYSPIEGLVVSSTIPYAGVNVSPSADEVVVVNPSTVYFSASVDQTDLPNIHEGMAGEITFDAYPDITVLATVRSISFTPKEDETGTVYDVKIDFDVDNSAFQYRLGMTGDIEFVLSERPPQITVPSTYIEEENGKSYILKLDKGRRVKTEITTGETLDNMTEVTSGLNEGDVIYDQTK